MFVNRYTLFAVATAALGLSACSSGAIGTQPQVSVTRPEKAGTLAFAMGTANISGINPFNSSPTQFIDLNVVASYRQPNGEQATLYNIPTISGPPGFTGVQTQYTNNAPGPDYGSGRLTDLTFDQGVTGRTTIVSGYGLCECGSDHTSPTGQQLLFTPYQQPIGLQFGVYPVGGPPAFPRTTDGNYPADFKGYSEGYVIVPDVAVAGTYSLGLAFPPNFETSVRATATVTGVRTADALPPLLPPSLTADGNGGGYIDLLIPPGVVETFVNIETGYNPSYGTSGVCGIPSLQPPYYYTVETKQSGNVRLFLPDTLGPTVNGIVLPTLCGGDQYTMFAVGFNYDAYGAAYPFSKLAKPILTGSNGEADLTQSFSVTAAAPPLSPSAMRRIERARRLMGTTR